MGLVRPSWDELFIGVAHQLATRATCDRAHVGCVLTVDRRIVSAGYNGSLPGMPHCDEVGHLMHESHCVRTIHAERNAVADAARRGVSVAGATAYVTITPCVVCLQLLVASGVERIVSAGRYWDDEISLQLLAGSSVKVEVIGGADDAG